MLQQTVEMCYTTIELVFTQYKPNEHNLLILRKIVDRFDDRLSEIFPMIRQRPSLFKHLNYAYIGGRYKNEKEFSVTKDQIDYWEKETEKLLKLTEEFVSKKLHFGRYLTT